MLGSQASEAPLPGPAQDTSSALVQGLVFLILMAASGVLAFFVFTGDRPLEAQDSEKPTRTTEMVFVPDMRVSRLIVLVDSEDRATILQAWRDTHPTLDANSFAAVEFSAPIPWAALQEAIVVANVTCPLEGCPTVSVLDLRGTAVR